MSDDLKWTKNFVLPVLLAEGRKTYGRAIRANYAAAGFDDIPKLGPRLLGGMNREGWEPTNIATDFGISKQAASKLVDTLVVRGYIEREVDPDDRRRLRLTLTDRGQAAADAGWEATDRIDRELEEKVGAEAVRQMRRTVGELIALSYDSEGEPRF
jgi:DNA-binding MarR family transcriptional regulator